METMAKSGYYYPNKLVRVAFEALAEVMGRNGLNAMLNYAHLRELIEHYPPDNLEKGFDFANFSAIHRAIEDMYGVQAGHAFIRSAGRKTFTSALSRNGAMAGVRRMAFFSLPLQTSLQIGIQAMALIFSQISDQLTTVEEN